MAYAAVCNHTVLAGPLHGKLVHSFPASDQYRWVSHNLSEYVGQRLHLELTADPKTPFAVVAIYESDTPPPPDLPPMAAPLTAQPSAEVLAPLLTRLREAESALSREVVWSSRLVLSLWDAPGIEGRVFIRGNPRSEGAAVPRRSLEALSGTEAIKHTAGSGRRELAEQWLNPADTPFLPRVAVNRVWHHLFGRGLVPTTDNFGVLGEPPTHPELLDYLAREFLREKWSVKTLIRRLVLSSTYRLASEGPTANREADPLNQFWHQFPLKRLEGEAIRDAILSHSGRLDLTMYGKSVPIYLTPFLDGRGRPGSGPLDGNGRRSLYLASRRNFISPFFLTFDTPIPFSTVGRRQVSNVPAQALILLNDPFVHQQAELWGKKIAASPGTTVERLERLILAAFTRPATAKEIESLSAFLAQHDQDPKAWAEVVHALVNVKEFIFLK
jgi:hypothetical protein